MNLTADGAVPTSQGTLYSVPPGRQCSISSIHVSNASGSARTATIYVNASGTARAISALNMALATDAIAISETPFKLDEGDTIEGVASGASVNYVITGIETAN